MENHFQAIYNTYTQQDKKNKEIISERQQKSEELEKPIHQIKHEEKKKKKNHTTHKKKKKK